MAYRGLWLKMRKQFQMFPTFSQNVTLQEVFETAAQINEELKRTEFGDAFCKRFTEFLGDGFSLFFAHVENR